MSAVLGKASIVDDPGRDGRAGGHLGKDALADGLEEWLVVPGRHGDDMVQGSMSAPDLVWVETGGHKLQTSELSRQKDAKAVVIKG